MFMTSTSSSRSAYTDSTTFAVDLDIVEEIFQRGRRATSFPQVFKSYTEVLQENGISATNDSVYYNFLLKVGVLKAPTWGDKWDLWKATRLNQTSPSRASVYRTTQEAISNRKSQQSFASSQLPEVRKRVPFLASASSDLDEGYTGGEESDASIRASPRIQLAKEGIEDYAPAETLDVTGEDLLSFDPPIRTSTPIFAQYPRSGNPPDYTASDVSQDFEQATEEFSTLGLSTPKAQTKQTLQTISWVDRIDDLSLEVKNQMEQKADAFYTYGLTWRCWNMWFKTSEWYRITYKNIITARNNLLLRQMLERWHKSSHRLLSLPPIADRHCGQHLKSATLKMWMTKLKERELDRMEQRLTRKKEVESIRKVLAHWKEKWEDKRTERWKKDMAERELGFIERRRKNQISAIFQHWRVEARFRYLKTSKEQELISSTFYAWHDLTTKQRYLKSILQDIQLRQKEDALHLWQKMATLKPKEKLAIDAGEGRLLARIWNDWKVANWLSQQSSAFDRRCLFNKVMTKWKSATINQQALGRKAQTFDKLRLLQTSLKQWRVASRESLFNQIREKRLQNRAFVVWKGEMDRVEKFNALAHQFTRKRQSYALSSRLTRWRSHLSSLQTLSLQARLVRQQHLVINCFSKWKASSRTVLANQALADKAYGFFALRMAFKTWRVQYGRRKASAWIKEKEMERLKPIFDKWRVLAKRYRGLEKREIAFQRFVEEQTKKRLLAKWTERVIEVKDRELRIVRQRDEQTVKNALGRWRSHLGVIRANKKKADDLLEIRENENLRRAFRFWRSQAKRSKRLRLVSERSIIERENKLLRDIWDKWWSRKREKDLDYIRKEVEFLHENVILYGVMDKWKANTHILPGITADSLRVKSKTWATWGRVLERRKRAKAMEKERNQKLLAEVFGLWKEAAAHKSMLNARKHRGRPRPSGSTLATTTHTIGARRSLPLTHLCNAPSSSHAPLPAAASGTSALGRAQSDHYRHDARGSESVVSEPVYSRLREELGRKRRGVSEEPASGNMTRGESRNAERLETPRSGSEMLRALRGVMPGR
ncbi:hypothetical protein J007_04817 [Cryptococcus neoformans]|nr:hypothetical protein J007_04817 [Cryptococcus neoformans var. grubii]OXC59612.1 hypothetical protein C358_04933 [Cryptococcus neoformans var. grubii MW-RSA852]